MKFDVALPQSLLESGEPPYVLAHRGCQALAPENSRAAFDLALEQGAQALETDLHISQDRHIVCFHDATLERMTDGRGALAERTLAQLKVLRLKGRGGFPPQTMPTLDEFLDAYARRAWLLLELKPPAWTSRRDIELLCACIDRHNARERVAVMSFSHAILAAVQRYAPALPCGPISLFGLLPSARYPLIGIWYPNLFLNPLYVRLCRRRGQIFAPLDPAPESRLRYYLWLGVDFVLSDHPAKTLAKLRELRG